MVVGGAVNVLVIVLEAELVPDWEGVFVLVSVGGGVNVDVTVAAVPESVILDDAEVL